MIGYGGMRDTRRIPFIRERDARKMQSVQGAGSIYASDSRGNAYYIHGCVRPILRAMVCNG